MQNENLGGSLVDMGFSPHMISKHWPGSRFNFENAIEKLVKATDESNAAKEGRVYISPEKKIRRLKRRKRKMREAVGREFKRKAAKREAKRLAQIHTRKLMTESIALRNSGLVFVV